MKRPIVLLLTLLLSFPSLAAKCAIVKIHKTKNAVKKGVHDTCVGFASWYGTQRAGRKTANGKHFDPDGLTVAHRSLPFGTMIRIVNLKNGLTVDAEVTDRGPMSKQRILDVSVGCAKRLKMLKDGVVRVMYYPIHTIDTTSNEMSE
jgi:rare lipoprotein A (peptidoglycan hydrolase)